MGNLDSRYNRNCSIYAVRGNLHSSPSHFLLASRAIRVFIANPDEENLQQQEVPKNRSQSSANVVDEEASYNLKPMQFMPYPMLHHSHFSAVAEYPYQIGFCMQPSESAATSAMSLETNLSDEPATKK
jgi:hypothetical protein